VAAKTLRCFDWLSVAEKIHQAGTWSARPDPGRARSVWCAALQSSPHPRLTSFSTTPTGDRQGCIHRADCREEAGTIRLRIPHHETLNKLKESVSVRLSQEWGVPTSLSELAVAVEHCREEEVKGLSAGRATG